MDQAAQRKRQSILRVEYQWIMRGAQARRTKNKDRIARYEELKAQAGPVSDGAVEMATLSAAWAGRRWSWTTSPRPLGPCGPPGLHLSHRPGRPGGHRGPQRGGEVHPAQPHRRQARPGFRHRGLGGDGAHRLLLPGGPGAGPPPAGVRLHPRDRRGGEDPGGELLRHPDDGALPLPHPAARPAHRQALRRGAAAAVPAVHPHGRPQHPPAGRAHQRPGRHHPGHSGGVSGDLPRGGAGGVPRPLLPGQDGRPDLRGGGGGRCAPVQRQLFRLPGQAPGGDPRPQGGTEKARRRQARPAEETEVHLQGTAGVRHHRGRHRRPGSPHRPAGGGDAGLRQRLRQAPGADEGPAGRPGRPGGEDGAVALPHRPGRKDRRQEN